MPEPRTYVEQVGDSTAEAPARLAGAGVSPARSAEETPRPRRRRAPSAPRARRPAREPRSAATSAPARRRRAARPRQAPEGTRRPSTERGGVTGFIASCWAELQAGTVARPRDADPGIRGDGASSSPSMAAYLGVLDAVFQAGSISLFIRHPEHVTNESSMFRWYVINTYSGHENKVKHNLEHRVETMGQQHPRPPGRRPDRAGLRDQGRREGPGREADHARLRARQHGDDRRRLGPGQEHPRRHRLRRLAQQADAALRARGRPPAPQGRATAERPRTRAQFSIGETVKVISGPLSDFSGEIAEINEDAAKLKVLVSIFGRETPVEVGYDQVKKI